jgi:hypothetical protein
MRPAHRPLAGGAPPAGAAAAIAGTGSAAAGTGSAAAGTGSAVAGIGAAGGGGGGGSAGVAGPVPGGMMTPSIVRSLRPASPPASKSNPQDSQNRPDLAAPQCGQGSAVACGCGACGCGSCGSCGWAPVVAPILMPHTSQKSLLADA